MSDDNRTGWPVIRAEVRTEKVTRVVVLDASEDRWIPSAGGPTFRAHTVTLAYIKHAPGEWRFQHGDVMGDGLVYAGYRVLEADDPDRGHWPAWTAHLIKQYMPGGAV